MMKKLTIPDCCWICLNLDQSIPDYDGYCGPSWCFCIKNIWFPTAKNSCKKQEMNPAHTENNHMNEIYGDFC